MAITKNEAKDKIEAIVNKMKSEIENTQSSRPFTDYINFISKQYEYSFYNTLLIWSKVKMETVMSGKKWNSIGRTIKDYSKKVWILAPTFIPITEKDASGKPVMENGKEKKNTILTGFKWVYIFVESNTEGKPLPICPVKIERNMQANMPEYQKLVMACGYPVIEKSIDNGCLGRTNGKEIIIEKSMCDADKFMVLVHELSHALNHYGENRKELSKEQKELEAESIAYIIGQRMGIDTEVNVNYMAIYKKDYDLMSSIGAIVKTTGIIWKMLNCDNSGDEIEVVKETEKVLS